MAAGLLSGAQPGSGPVIVAVVDTGVDASVPVRHRWRCLRVCRPAGSPKDPHGTWVARTLLAVEPTVALDSYDVTDRYGSIVPRRVAAAIRHAGASRIPLINVSLTVSGRSPELRRVVRESRHSLVVAAAGNQGRELTSSERVLPCMTASSNVMCVGSPGGNFSRRWVDLVAPGVVSFEGGPNGAELRGSSAATAFASGWAAGVLTRTPGLGPTEIRARVVDGRTSG